MCNLEHFIHLFFSLRVFISCTSPFHTAQCSEQNLLGAEGEALATPNKSANKLTKPGQTKFKLRYTSNVFIAPFFAHKKKRKKRMNNAS